MIGIKMRIAIVADIHANLTALEAVVKDLREMAPDLVLHGGDLADGGARPAAVVDRIRDLGWAGVQGNTDEMHARPEALEEFASGSKAPVAVWKRVREMAAWAREVLGEERTGWLGGLARVQVAGEMALVHASAESTWRAPGMEAGDEELRTAFASLGKPLVVYGHIHKPFVRRVGSLTVANAGSAGLPYDGDQRASYLLVDGADARVRRVEYALEEELEVLVKCGLPHADWVARMLRNGLAG